MPYLAAERPVRQPVLMCSSCWNIQPPEDELTFEMDKWVHPTTFMASAVASSRHYVLVDGYCEECLTRLVEHVHLAARAGAHERLNA